ncbi:MAG: MFS transporter TsgA [Fusobacteria bacterium]|nr:MFS transporter TsgA [Fusobacteriota bacterium]
MELTSELTTPGNKKLLTWICYLSYFFTGTLIADLGNLMVPVSNYYHVPIGDMGYIFTYSNLGMWIMIFVSGFLLRSFTIKNILIVASIIVIVMICVLSGDNIPLTFKVAMFLVGAIGGIFMAVSTFMIVQLYVKPKERGTQVIFTDAFFSLALFVIPLVFGALLAHNVFWMAIFFFIALLGLLMIVLTVIAKFDVFKSVLVNKNAPKTLKTDKEKWGIAIYLAALAAFLFILAELMWLVNIIPYYETALHWNAAQAALPSSLEGLAQIIALFLSPFYTKIFRLNRMIILCSALSIIFLAVSVTSHDFLIVCISMFLLGIFNATVYAAILAFGTLQVKNTPPFLMTGLLFCGTTGTMLSTPFGSYLTNMFGTNVAAGLHNVLIWSVILYILCLITMLFASATNRMYKIHGAHAEMH